MSNLETERAARAAERPSFPQAEARTEPLGEALSEAGGAEGEARAAANPARRAGPSAAAGPRSSIVIPCYRSGAWLPELVERIAAVLAGIPSAGETELILVDDASPDDVTWPAIEAAAARHDWVHGLALQSNVGQYRALMAGLEAARGELVVTMDDDLQTPPEELPRLFEAARAHPEVDAVIARYPAKQHSRLRNLGSHLVKRLHTLVYDSPPELDTTSFRILRRPLVDAICAERGVDPVFPSILLRNTRRLLNVDVAHAPRTHGESGYGLGRMVEIVLTQLFSASTLPLRIVSLIGLFFSTAALLFGLYSFVGWLRGTITEPGFTTLVLLLALLGGLILLSLGVIGEYLVRVVVETGGTRRYVVRARTDAPGGVEGDGEARGDGA